MTKCDNCGVLIDVNIYAYIQATVGDKRHSFCKKECLNKYLRHYGYSTIDDELETDEPIESRWQILDL